MTTTAKKPARKKPQAKRKIESAADGDEQQALTERKARIRALRGSMSPKSPAGRGTKEQRKKDKTAKRNALIESMYGSLSWMDYSVDEYLREKYAETERETRS